MLFSVSKKSSSDKKVILKNIYQKVSDDPWLNSIWVMDIDYKPKGYTEVPYGTQCHFVGSTIAVRVYPNRFTMTKNK